MEFSPTATVRSNLAQRFKPMKLFASILFLVCCHLSMAQQIFLKPDSLSGKYTYSEIIKLDTALTEKSVYNSLVEWANSPSNKLYYFPANETTMPAMFLGGALLASLSKFTDKENIMTLSPKVKSTNEDEFKLSASGIFKYSDKGGSCMQVCYTRYNVNLQVKKGRVKATFTNYSMEVYYHSTTSTSENSNYTLEEWVLGKRYDISKLCRNRTSEYTIELQKQNFQVLESLKKHLSGLSAAASDDW